MYRSFALEMAMTFKWSSLVNIRAIRNDVTNEDYVPVNISVVSVDLNEKEFDRDEFNYSQFLLKGSKIVDRATTFDLKVPSGGKVLLGIK